MDKYEYRVKTEQMQEYLEKKQYKKAMEIADTIDWRRVKNVGTLNTVSEIYEYNGEYQKSRDILFVAFDRSPGSRKIAYRLGLLALRINDIEEAADCYEEFVKLAPKDPNQYILKYRILRAQGAPLSEQIEALEEFKKAEYIEKWAYELARLYHEAGMTAECLEECDDLILWFSEGKYVYQAMELKMQYKPLTPLQQQKYDARPGAYKKSRSVKRDTSARVPVPLDEVIREDETVRKDAVTKPAKEETREEVREEVREEEAESAKEELPGQDAGEKGEMPQSEKSSSITRVVKGATLQEAIASGMALANGFRTVEKTMAKVKEGIRQVTGQIHMDSLFEKGEEEPKTEEAPSEELTIEEDEIVKAAEPAPVERKKRAPLVTDQKTSALRATGQMRIEEILQEWEAKQRANAEAIERQREEDDERLRRERDEIELRKELERRDAARRAEEEAAARKAEEEEAVKKLAEKEALQKAAARKAAEEEAERKAAEEEAARKAVEEAARKAAEEEAIRKAAEEAARKAAEEEAIRKAAEEEAARKAAEEEAIRKAAEEAARKAAEEEAIRKAAEEEAARKAAEEEAARKAIEEEAVRRQADAKARNKKRVRQTTQENIAIESGDKKQDVDAIGKTKRIPDDIVRLMEELGNDDRKEAVPGDKEEESVSDIVESRYQARRTSEEGLKEELKAGKDLEEDSFEEDFEEESFGGDIEEEEGFEEEKLEEDIEEEEDFGEEGFGEEDFEEEPEEKEDFEDGDFEEEDFGEEDFEEEDFGEEELEEEEDFGEEDFEEEDFEDGDFEEEDFEEEDFEEEDFGEEEPEEEEDFGEEESEEEEGFEEEDFGEEDFEEEEDFEDGDFEEEDFEEDDFEEDDFDDVGDYIEEEEEFGDDIEEDDFEEDDYEEDELGEEDFEEDETGVEDEEDFEEEDLEEDEIEEDLEIEEPSEEEIQARIKKSKGKGVPFDTGFVVTGRYDLSATSEIGLKAGLTEEQKKLFSYFVPVRGMSEQIVEVLDNDRRARKEGTSRTGNLLVIGRKGSGKTVLAVDIVKAIQKQRNLKQGKVAIVTGESLNKKELTNIIQKLRGGAIIIEKAGKLNSRTVKELNYLMEKKTGELLFVLEDQRKPLERVLTANPDFKKKFTSRLELPIFINDELVTFGQTYAKENGYKLDEMGILALYSRIDVMQREDHAVSVAEVKDIMDEAIEHSQKANVKHLARRVFGRSTDESDRIILKEEDFKI